MHARTDHTDGPELTITDNDGDRFLIGTKSTSRSSFAQVCVQQPGGMSAVYLDRRDAIALRDFLTLLLSEPT